MGINDYIAGFFIDKSFHFTDNYVFGLDVKGRVSNYRIDYDNEIILYIQTNESTKTMSIGLNNSDIQIHGMGINDYIAKQFIDKSFHFTCNCIFGLDVKGRVSSYKLANNGEIILYIQTNESTKTIPIGLNTPNLHIEEVF